MTTESGNNSTCNLYGLWREIANIVWALKHASFRRSAGDDKQIRKGIHQHVKPISDDVIP